MFVQLAYHSPGFLVMKKIYPGPRILNSTCFTLQYRKTFGLIPIFIQLTYHKITPLILDSELKVIMFLKFQEQSEIIVPRINGLNCLLDTTDAR